MLTLKEKRIAKYTSPNWVFTRLNQCWEAPCYSTSGFSTGKRSQAACLLHG